MPCSWRRRRCATTSLDVERPLGHEDRVGAAGDARVRGDPAGVAAHHLDDHHAVVRLGGRVQAVDRVGDDLHGRLEADRHVGAAEVVVDRLGHAHDRHAVAVQAQGDAERVLAADRDQRVHAAAPPACAGPAPCRPLPLGVRVRARGAQDRAAPRQDAGGALARQLDRVALEHARPAAAKADELVPALRQSPPHDRADDRVQPGTVASSGEQPDPTHRPSLRARGQMPWPGRNSLVNGGRPAVLGSCWSSPCVYIQLPNVAHAEGSCQPYGSLASAGCAAGSVCSIDSSWSLASSDGLALTHERRGGGRVGADLALAARERLQERAQVLRRRCGPRPRARPAPARRSWARPPGLRGSRPDACASGAAGSPRSSSSRRASPRPCQRASPPRG